jgi:hypothetical protein
MEKLMRRRGNEKRCWNWTWAVLGGLLAGCGTTRMTDTQRTATEQLLISHAIDESVSAIDFSALRGKPVYFDPQFLDGTVDRGYLVSSLRQHLLANGCLLQEDRAQATYVVEARSGGVGTDRHSLLLGVPQMTLPTILPGQPSQIPEIPFAKKNDQRGTAKIAVFAYNRKTGHPVWQSGTIQSVSRAKDLWLMGAGPFQNGSIRNGMDFAGEQLPLLTFGSDGEHSQEPKPPVPTVPVTQAASWSEVKRTAPEVATQLGEILGTASSGNPIALGALLRARLGGPVESPSVTSAAPLPAPPTTNPGGQAQTEPSQILVSGLGAPHAQ